MIGGARRRGVAHVGGELSGTQTAAAVDTGFSNLRSLRMYHLGDRRGPATKDCSARRLVCFHASQQVSA